MSKERRPPRNDNKSVELLRDMLVKLGPVFGGLLLLTLNLTQRFITKWMGMDISTFMEQVGWHDWFPWSRTIDPTILLNPTVLLEQACAEANEVAVRAFLKGENKSDYGDGKGKHDMQSAFRKGVTSGSKFIVQILLGFNVDVDATDDNGRSALHDAAERGHEAVMDLLLNGGGDFTTIDKNGDIPMDLAVQENHEAVVRLLMSRTGAILASSFNRTRPLSSPKQRNYTCATEHDTGFMATVLHFYIDRPTAVEESSRTSSPAWEEYRVQVEPVEHLVLDWNGLFNDVLHNRTGNETYPETSFKWIHLPANNVSRYKRPRHPYECTGRLTPR